LKIAWLFLAVASAISYFFKKKWFCSGRTHQNGNSTI
jgi:hypothetical protein